MQIVRFILGVHGLDFLSYLLYPQVSLGDLKSTNLLFYKLPKDIITALSMF